MFTIKRSCKVEAMIIRRMTHVYNKNIMQGFHVLLVRVFGHHTFSKVRENTSDL
jgi:hypothetical protein